jgi:hypothetical protein
MTNRKIIVIDDNTQNGELLYEACRVEAPEWSKVFLQVTTLTPDFPPARIPGTDYQLINDLKAAAEAVRVAAGTDECQLIVFYDCQLLDLQTKTEAATNSPITAVLLDLMNQLKRKLVVNVHSSEQASHVIGETIDKTSKRVIVNESVTKKQDLGATKDIVRKTLQLWQNLYSEKSVSLREFIDAMQQMYHEQIQNFEAFIKKKGKESREDFQDPKQLLMQFMGMGTVEFEKHFCVSSGDLKRNVIEAMKSISGVVDEDTGRNEGRPMTWAGGWLLGLGQFRSFPFRDSWENFFTPGDLEKGDHSLMVHAYQTKEKRTATLESFGEMCSVLFLKKGTLDQCVLEKVTLNNEKFSFLLDFPCVSPSQDRKNSLLDRILSEAEHAMKMTYKTEEQLAAKQGHDTSRAIWRQFLASHLSDLSELIGDVDHGLFGSFTRMNIVSVGETKTEVIWQER